MRITLSTLQKMAQEGNRITQLTCYDASFAAVLEAGGVETLLIGDSLGNVLQGHETTLPVKLRDIVYHTECVARGAKRAFIIGDMPFATFQISPQETFRNAAEIMAAGAHMVKLEGGGAMLDTVRFLTERGIPVCGHLGLTPQSVHQFGGFKVQGRADDDAQRMIEEAQLLEDAGAGMIVAVGKDGQPGSARVPSSTAEGGRWIIPRSLTPQDVDSALRTHLALNGAAPVNTGSTGIPVSALVALGLVLGVPLVGRMKR